MKLQKGTILQNGKYTIEKTLEQGSFGITYLATAKIPTEGVLGKMDVSVKVTIKEFFMGELNVRNADGTTVEGSSGSVFTNYRKRFRKEAENLAKLSHSNIVKVFDVFDENGTSYYVMEFLDGENLDEYISSRVKIPELEAIEIIHEVGGALSYMHSRHMLHLDIKPKNVMRTRTGKYYLIDFGLSKQYTNSGEPESSTTIGLGTPGYAPLEQSQYLQDGSFPATLDVYALGATLFKMLTGQRPPEATVILNEGFPIEILRNANVSKNMIVAIAKSMAASKKSRTQNVAAFLKSLPHSQPTDERTIIKDAPNPKEKISSHNNSTANDKPKTHAEKSGTEVKGVLKYITVAMIWMTGFLLLFSLLSFIRLVTGLAASPFSSISVIISISCLICLLKFKKSSKVSFLIWAILAFVLAIILNS